MGIPYEKQSLLVAAWTFVARRPRVSGDHLSRLLGHTTHALMANRLLLSAFRACYDFVTALGPQRARIWPAVAREAEWIAALLPLSRASLRLPWAEDCAMYDASLSGAGVVTRGDIAAQLPEIGRVRERSRYR